MSDAPVIWLVGLIEIDLPLKTVRLCDGAWVDWPGRGRFTRRDFSGVRSRASLAITSCQFAQSLFSIITASGEPDEVRSKVNEYVATGCTCPILYPLADDVRLMIDTFAGGI